MTKYNGCLVFYNREGIYLGKVAGIKERFTDYPPTISHFSASERYKSLDKSGKDSYLWIRIWYSLENFLKRKLVLREEEIRISLEDSDCYIVFKKHGHFAVSTLDLRENWKGVPNKTCLDEAREQYAKYLSARDDPLFYVWNRLFMLLESLVKTYETADDKFLLEIVSSTVLTISFEEPWK